MSSVSMTPTPAFFQGLGNRGQKLIPIVLLAIPSCRRARIEDFSSPGGCQFHPTVRHRRGKAPSRRAGQRRSWRESGTSRRRHEESEDQRLHATSASSHGTAERGDWGQRRRGYPRSGWLPQVLPLRLEDRRQASATAKAKAEREARGPAMRYEKEIAVASGRSGPAEVEGRSFPASVRKSGLFGHHREYRSTLMLRARGPQQRAWRGDEWWAPPRRQGHYHASPLTPYWLAVFCAGLCGSPIELRAPYTLQAQGPDKSKIPPRAERCQLLPLGIT